MAADDDIFDPNTWDLGESHECRIYGDDGAQTWAVVDPEDYAWAIRWKWSIKRSRGGRKVYLRRVGHEGSRLSRVMRTIWLHVEILKRAGELPPSPLHTMVDHSDGDGFHCRKRNLSWATPSQNRRNARPPSKRCAA